MPRSRITAPTEPPHNTFILAEDEALKQLLERTVTLPDGKGIEQPVRVWFRWPDPGTQITYPFITIDLVGLNPAQELWESDYRLYLNSFWEEGLDGQLTGERRLYDPDTSPVTVNPDPTKMFWRRNFLAFKLIYQVNLWANNVWHDRYLSARMIRDIIHPRPSWLSVEADGTFKRLETLGWTAADLPSQEGGSKRIFRKIYTLSVQTEIPQDTLDQARANSRTLIQKLLLRGSYMEYDPLQYWTEEDEPVAWNVLHTRDEVSSKFGYGMLPYGEGPYGGAP